MKLKLFLLFFSCCIVLSACADPSSSENSVARESGTASEHETSISDTTVNEEFEAGMESSFPEFTGTDISEESLICTDLNSVDAYRAFCFSDGMIYFSNPDDDWKLYSYDGETAKCLTDINAYCLNYFDGEVYFLSSSRKMDIYDVGSGKIHKYDLQNGEVEQIGNDDVNNLWVNDFGIFYCKEAEGKKYVYKANSQFSEEERLYEGERIGFAGDYIISCEPSGDGKSCNCFLQKNDEKICLISNENVFSYFVNNGVFYYTNEKYITKSVDLRNGETNILPVGTSYAFCGETMYFSTQGSDYGLYKTVNGESKRVEMNGDRIIRYSDEELLLPPEERYSSGYTLRSLYSDNVSLYALAEPNNGSHTYYMVKLETQNIDVAGEESTELTFVKLLGNNTYPKPAF